MRASFILLMTIISLFSIEAQAAADSNTSANASDEPKVERVGGDYLVTKIERQDDANFVIEFKSLSPSGKFDVIRLYSDHVHVGVKLGQKIRLSAEVYRTEADFAEASQVLVFLKSDRGQTPVWLLSNRVVKDDLTGSRYLEMHVPLNDYHVL